MLMNIFLFFAICQVKCVVSITVPERIRKNGYRVEIFQDVLTEDKHLLTVFRIPCGNPCTNSSTDKPVVFLMHGLFGTSRDYIIMGPERGLGYLLADRGYDVWIGNARGSQYSRKHAVLDPDVHSKYWDFSWHEIGYYDLPAIVSLIKTTTKTDKVSYIGNSMGTTVFFVLNSARPEYNKEFNVMIALAPAAFMNHMSSPVVVTLARVSTFLNQVGDLLGIHEVPPKGFDSVLGQMGEVLCQETSPLIDICRTLFSLIAGYNPEQLNKSAVGNIIHDGPSPVSKRQLTHYAQSINSGYFRQYNFGPSKNMQKYGKAEPPSYELDKITAPVNIFYSDGDWLCTPKDVERLCKEMTNCALMFKVAMDSFNHLDFIFSIDVVSLVYDQVFEVLENYNKN